MRFFFLLLAMLALPACVHLTQPGEGSVTGTRSILNRAIVNVKEFHQNGKDARFNRLLVRFLKTDNGNIWGRIRKGFSIVSMASVDIEQQIKSYSRHPECFSKMLERSRPYLFHVVEELEKRGMPMELALIPFVESAYNPQALSSAEAAGIWQFIPSTGREYKLKQNFFSDERRDVLASTDAALGYLEKLYAMFGDWRLALAAYNWGEGNLQKSIKRNLMKHQPIDYIHLKLPRETRSYIPKIEAIKEVILNSKRFGIVLPNIPNHPYFVSVTASRDIDIKVAAKLAALSLEDFCALNPSFNRPIILGATSPQILLPYKNAHLFTHGIKTYKEALSSWTIHRVVRSEYPEVLARKIGMNLKAFMTVNKIPHGVRLKSGSVVLVPKMFKSVNTDIDAFIAKNAVLTLESVGVSFKRRVIRTRIPLTVFDFAKQYKVRVEQLRRWNPRLPKRVIPSGTVVVLHMPLRRNTVVRKKKIGNMQMAGHSLGGDFTKKISVCSEGCLKLG